MAEGAGEGEGGKLEDMLWKLRREIRGMQTEGLRVIEDEHVAKVGRRRRQRHIEGEVRRLLKIERLIPKVHMYKHSLYTYMFLLLVPI